MFRASGTRLSTRCFQSVSPSWFNTRQYPPLLELPPELDPEAALSVWHPVREIASETVRTASNVDAMRLKVICFPHEGWTSALSPPARCAALMN